MWRAPEPKVKFLLGRASATPAATLLIEEAGTSITELLERHSTGDWGDVDDSDARANDLAVENGERVMSTYAVCGGEIWVITDRARSSTTLTTPEEF